MNNNHTYEFPITPLFFWVKGKIEVDPKLTKITTKNTILGIIPAGQNKQSIPMSNVSTASIRNSVKISNIIIGIFFIAVAFSSIEGTGSDFASSLIATLVWLILGVAELIAAFPVYLDIETGGTVRTFYAPIYAKKILDEVSDDINDVLVNTEDRRDTSMAADRIVDAINNNK